MASGEKLFLHFGRDGASIRSLSKNEIVASRSGAAVGGTATAGLTGRGTGAGPSEGLMKWVARKEAFSPTAFSDYGQVNIGYGTSARGRQTLTEPEAWEEMRGELGKHLKAIDELNPNTPPGVRNALASLAFNTGGSWYHKGDTNPDGSLTLKGLIRAGKWAEARDRFLQYNKASGKNITKQVGKRCRDWRIDARRRRASGIILNRSNRGPQRRGIGVAKYAP